MLGIIPIIWKRNPQEILERAKKILKNFSQIEEDKEAVKFPWAVIAAVIRVLCIFTQKYTLRNGTISPNPPRHAFSVSLSNNSGLMGAHF